MAEPAGTTIPEEPVDMYHCSTAATGWLNGHHPATAGETINGKVCFTWNGNTCLWETQIQIKHCTSYYLYYLVDTPPCRSRYCSTSTTLIGNVKTNRSEILQCLPRQHKLKCIKNMLRKYSKLSIQCIPIQWRKLHRPIIFK